LLTGARPFEQRYGGGSPSPSQAKAGRSEQNRPVSPPVNVEDILGKKWSNTDFPRNNLRHSPSKEPLLSPFDHSQAFASRSPLKVTSGKNEADREQEEEQEDKQQENKQQEGKEQDNEEQDNEEELPAGFTDQTNVE
jgi:hypothetical protein